MDLGLLLLLTFLSAFALGQSSLPDAPSALQARFSWHDLREVPRDPNPKWYEPRRTFKQVLRSPQFWMPEAVAVGTAFADARMNNCNPRGNAPCGGDIYRDALIPMAVLVPLHLVATRFFTPLIAWGSCGYIATRHVRGMVTGFYP